jgi:hypothetical protein
VGATGTEDEEEEEEEEEWEVTVIFLSQYLFLQPFHISRIYHVQMKIILEMKLKCNDIILE